MCGIAGSINFKLNHDTIKSSLLHRGPDEQAGVSCDNVELYHLRLSIVDFNGGKQPMEIDDRYIITFNGEIYNHIQLRNDHKIICKSSSDTETLLLLFQKYGIECLQYLDGMFAFAIYDKLEKSLFLARDRAGKKPLYLYNDGSKFFFSSELNCIKNSLSLEINNENFYHYFHLGFFYKELTPYKNVNKLEAGSYALINCNTLNISIKKWWNVHNFFLKNSNDSFNEALEKTNNYLREGVKRRIISSDLEVGCFLSGGIDSGLVTSIASEYSNRLKTITVSFDDVYDETPLAELVSQKYGTDHTNISISFDSLIHDVEDILCNYGEPYFDSSAIPSYYVSKEAKKQVTVILNGDGADELFAGYRRYVPFSKYDFFSTPNYLKTGISFLLKGLPYSNEKKSNYNYFFRLLSLAEKSNISTYFSAGSDIIEGFENNLIHSNTNYLSKLIEDFDYINNSKLSGLKKIMNLDFDTNFDPQILAKMDIATMSQSLEGRSPFMCKELLEYAPTLSDKFKIKGTSTKYILRTLAKSYLPASLINQPKRGFEIPLKKWVNGNLKEIIHDYVGAPSAFNKNFIKSDFTQKLIENKVKISDEKRAKILWTLFSLEVWYKKIYLANYI
jgi:asparagine synthase (glutamine-hydrolysing)